MDAFMRKLQKVSRVCSQLPAIVEGYTQTLKENDGVVNKLVEEHSLRFDKLELQMKSLGPRSMDDVKVRFTQWRNFN